jgi:hypothetical protein
VSSQVDIAYEFVNGPYRAVIGNSVAAQADTDFCGILTQPISGLEGTEIRLNLDLVTGGDGAVPSDGLLNPRSLSLDGEFTPDPDPNLNAKVQKLLGATNARSASAPATMKWTDSGSVAKVLWFMRYGKPTVGGTRPKTYSIPLVCPNPLIQSNDGTASAPYAGAYDTTVTTTSVTNAGDEGSYPVFTLSSPSNPVLTNNTTGEHLNLTISGGGTLTVDFFNHTITQGGVNRYSALNVSASSLKKWWKLVSGSNSITVTGGGTVHMYWRSAWSSG